MTITELIVSQGLADNIWAAAHIVTQLHLAELKTNDERLTRVRLYRHWRNAGESRSAAYIRAMKGESPPELPGMPPIA